MTWKVRKEKHVTISHPSSGTGNSTNFCDRPSNIFKVFPFLNNLFTVVQPATFSFPTTQRIESSIPYCLYYLRIFYQFNS